MAKKRNEGNIEEVDLSSFEFDQSDLEELEALDIMPSKKEDKKVEESQSKKQPKDKPKRNKGDLDMDES